MEEKRKNNINIQFINKTKNIIFYLYIDYSIVYTIIKWAAHKNQEGTKKKRKKERNEMKLIQ